MKDIIKFFEFTHNELFYHSLHVSFLAVNLARICNCDELAPDVIFAAGIFHDVGKTQIPAPILQKPSALSRKEVELIRNHPLDSAKFIQQSPFILQKSGFTEKDINNIIFLIKNHHEIPDGSGYPGLLDPSDFSLMLKIFCISDKLCALLEPRSYRLNKGLVVEQACTIIFKEHDFRIEAMHKKRIIDYMFSVYNTKVIDVTTCFECIDRNGAKIPDDIRCIRNKIIHNRLEKECISAI